MVYRYDVIIERCRNVGAESPRRPRQTNEEERPGDKDRKLTPLTGSKGGDRQFQTDCRLLVKKTLEKTGLQKLLVIYVGANMLFTTTKLNNSILVKMLSSFSTADQLPHRPRKSIRSDHRAKQIF